MKKGLDLWCRLRIDRATAAAPASAGDHASFREIAYFPALDGLRAVAVLMVILYHCPRLQLPILESLQLAGDAGVDVFFVLSGFLITTLLLREPEDPPRRRIGRFYGKRVLRIFPLYYLAIGLYWAKGHVSPDPAVLGLYEAYIPAFLLYGVDIVLAGDPSPFPPFGIAWSLGVEEKFYLFWPLIVVWLRPRSVFLAAAALIVLTCGWRLWLVHQHAGDLVARLYYSFDVRMDAIMWGCALAAAMHGRRGYRLVDRMAGSPAIGLLAAIAFVLLATALDNGRAARYVVLPALITLVLPSLVTRSEGSLRTLLGVRPLGFIGMISYGMYVLHPIAISVGLRIAGDTTLAECLCCAIVSITLTVGLAAVSYRWYERRFLSLKHRLFARPEPVSEALPCPTESVDGGSAVNRTPSMIEAKPAAASAVR